MQLQQDCWIQQGKITTSIAEVQVHFYRTAKEQFFLKFCKEKILLSELFVRTLNSVTDTDKHLLIFEKLNTESFVQKATIYKLFNSLFKSMSSNLTRQCTLL
jgi:hypothetical protein